MTRVPFKTSPPSPADQALHADILALVRRHLTPDTPDRFLAIVSQIVGAGIAMQDQRKMTPEMAMEVVTQNISIGNRAVLDNLQDTRGTA